MPALHIAELAWMWMLLLLQVVAAVSGQAAVALPWLDIEWVLWQLPLLDVVLRQLSLLWCLVMMIPLSSVLLPKFLEPQPYQPPLGSSQTPSWQLAQSQTQSQKWEPLC